MPAPLEPSASHDPSLTQRHAAGGAQETRSPAERALAPEGDAPLQSANGVADDGTYVGQGGGYGGAAAPATESGLAQVDTGNPRGEGTYGFPSGPEVGLPGGEHQPGQPGKPVAKG